MEFLHTKRGKIAYQYFQSKESRETLVLAHGIGMDMMTWEPMLPYIHHYNVLLFDFRGHGYSDSFNGEFNWRILYDDFFELLGHLSIEHYHIVSHGLGLHFIINLLNDEPEVRSIQSITSIGSLAYYPKKIATKGIEVRKDFVQEHGFSKLADILIPQLIHKRSNENTKLIKNALGRTTEESYFSLFKICINELSTDRLKTINLPILLLSGELDVNYPRELAVMTANYFENSKYYIIPDSSNMIQIEKPVETADFIHKFVQELLTTNKQELSNFDYIKELNHTLSSMLLEGFEKVNPPSSFKVNLLNGFYIEVDGVEVKGKWNQRKVKSIMAYLALNGQVSREKLCDILWFDLPLADALKNVRVALNHIKNIFKGAHLDITEYIEIDHEKLSLKIEVNCDVIHLISMLNQIEKLDEDEDKITEYVKWLDQLYYPIFDDLYDDWILEVRDNLENKIMKVLNFLMGHAEEKGDVEAISHYRSLLGKMGILQNT